MKAINSESVAPQHIEAAAEKDVEYSSQVSLISTKIEASHQSRLAIVYVRQSTLQQVMDHRESEARQYALADYAQDLGWPTQRVLVIDEDQGHTGKTAEHRSGFQRVMAEVALDHVGIVLGLEMSRLARSCKDWHQLLEVCALFGVLLGDQDGIYDPNDANDRLLLGLKGTMSEMELFAMRNRLERGRLFKAERGELFNDLPFGYLKLPSGEVVLEPDEQAREVVQLLFDKFDELGSVNSVFRYLIKQGIRLGMRERIGPQRGQLVWRRPSLPVMLQTFKHPFYAGAYAYGRRTVDRKRRAARGGRAGQIWRPMSEWKVLKRDRLPAYITCEQFLANQDRLQANRPGGDSPGAPNSGSALLSGLLVCGLCGRRLQTQYNHIKSPYYICVQGYREGNEETCCGVSGNIIDELVSRQVLVALEPAAINLSVRASQDVDRERERLSKHWQRQLERARQDANRAERQYQLVEPENRLVARTLEQKWEEELTQLRQLEQEHHRFLEAQPALLTSEECRQIESLSTELPVLWHAATTTNADRKEIIRCLIERVVVHADKDSDLLDVTISWQGGFTNQHQLVRPLGRYDQHRDYQCLIDRIIELRRAGFETSAIAKQLDAEGFRPARQPNGFNVQIVRKLMQRAGIGDDRNYPDILQSDEWFAPDLAKRLNMDAHKLRNWAIWGWLHARKTPIQKLWILWADADDLRRLEQLRDRSTQGVKGHPTALTTPKPRPE